MSYDWNEEQRIQRMQRDNKLKAEAREMSNADLYRALSWQTALAEHGDEIGEYRGSHKADAIRSELARRGHRI